MKYYGPYTKQAAQLFRKADRVFCRVIDEKIYLCDGYVCFVASPIDYDAVFRPVFQRDAGNWERNADGFIDSCSIDISRIFIIDSRAQLLEKCPVCFDVMQSKAMSKVYSFVTADHMDALIVNSAFIDAFQGVAWYGTTPTNPLFAFYPDSSGDCIGLVLPIRIDSEQRRAALGYYRDISAQERELEKTVNRLRKENAALNEQLEACKAANSLLSEVPEDITNALEAIKEEKERALADLTEAENRIKELESTLESEDLKTRRELSVKVSILEYRLKQAAPGQVETVETKLVRACEKIQALGLFPEIHGEKTAVPIVWIKDTIGRKSELKEIGAKYSAKYDAYYMTVA